MNKKQTTILAIAALLTAVAFAQQTPPAAAAAKPAQNPGGPNAGVLSNEPFGAYGGMIYTGGFDPLFNRINLDGWHPSRTNFHGTTPMFFVANGILVGTQGPKGFGGILLSDRKFKNVEIYMEIKPDWGCDGGRFLRSAEDGSAYQVMLDYLPGGNMGGVIGERLVGVGGQRGPAGGQAQMTPEERKKRMAEMQARNQGWQKAWKREDWNSIRVRMEGVAPHVQVWINDEKITDFQDTANHAKGGIEEGPIGIQMHGGNRWLDGGFWRWRVIAVKDLP